jgi:glycosyltransferase involved in cell wall biosynthesis
VRLALLGDARSEHFERWASEMAQRGVDVLVLSDAQPVWTDRWLELRPNRPPVPCLGLGTRMIGRQVGEACRAGAADVLHAHYMQDWGYWAAASAVHPFVMTCWGSDLFLSARRSLRDRLRTRRALQVADLVTGDSLDLLNAAVALGAARPRTRLVGWGVDAEEFAPSSSTRERVRAEWNLGDATVVVSTRLHKPLYRIDIVLRGVASALAARPDLALVIASDGPQRSTLEILACELDIADRVRFLGRVPSIAEVLAGGDVYVSVPSSDGTSVSLLEAMAMGLPVVVSDVPSNREWVTDGVVGFVWTSQDPAQLGALIIQAARAGRTMGSNGREVVVARADRRREMDSMLRYYEDLLHQRSHR